MITVFWTPYGRYRYLFLLDDFKQIQIYSAKAGNTAKTPRETEDMRVFLFVISSRFHHPTLIEKMNIYKHRTRVTRFNPVTSSFNPQ